MTVSATRYRKPDGTLSANRADAIRVPYDRIKEIAGYTSVLIPPAFTAAMAGNETGDRGDSPPAANQEDTDRNEDGTLKAQTFGLLQMGASEQARSGIAGSLLDPAVNIAVFSKIMESNLRSIAALAKVDVTRPIPVDVFRYLAWSHNNGLGAVEKSIRAYGLDWDKFKARPQNEYVRTKLIPYADRAVASLGGITTKLAQLIDATTGTKGEEGETDATTIALVALGLGAAFLLWKAL